MAEEMDAWPDVLEIAIQMFLIRGTTERENFMPLRFIEALCWYDVYLHVDPVPMARVRQ